MSVKKIILRSIATLFILGGVLYSGVVLYFLRTAEPSYVMLCAGGEGFRIPRQVCREWIYAFRGNREDVEELQWSIGLGWVFVLPKEDWKPMARFWLAKGADINHRDPQTPSSLTILQGAVLGGKAGEVAFLLELGADPALRDAQGRTALDWAEKLQARYPDEAGRAEIAALLKNARDSKK